ncbi:MAG: hypothetical protein HZC54_03225 [Verrucomicrobia bacterium]|nr:hypothetical protein [Verrucomicrobiota bacterium]
MRLVLLSQAEGASHSTVSPRRLMAMTLAVLVASLGLSGCDSKPPASTQSSAPPATNAVNSTEELLRLKAEKEKQGTLLEQERATIERSSARKSLLMEERMPMSVPSASAVAPEKADIPSTSKAVPDPMQIR